jgi:NADH-quinone oxidoreductase subunit H
MEDGSWVLWAVALLKNAFAVGFVMQIVPLLIWAERKGASYIQDRPGPNRAHILGIRAAGLVHTLVDVVKLITKEDIIPGHVSKAFWFAAPVVSMSVALCTFVVVPWGDYLLLPLSITETLGMSAALQIPLQVANVNGGMLVVLALSSLGIYGVMLAGWASNNKFSLLGGLRASAQMVSYELPMGLTVVAMFLIYGTVRLDEMVAQQAGAIWNWGVFSGFGVIGIPAFVMFWTAVFAETNRLPFDLPEGEAELVAGYHTEYSSLRFALFFMAEYAHMIVGSAVTATLFFGGYNVPFLDGAALRANADLILTVVGFGAVVPLLAFSAIAWQRRERLFYKSIPKDDIRHREPKFWTAVWGLLALAHVGIGALGLTGMVGETTIGPELVAFVAQLTALVLKVLIGCWIIIWVRWTLPRFRYDQLMNLGWRGMLPASLALVLLAGLWVVVRQTLLA